VNRREHLEAQEASVPECQWGVSGESDLRCRLGLQYLGLSSEPACEGLRRPRRTGRCLLQWTGTESACRLS